MNYDSPENGSLVQIRQKCQTSDKFLPLSWGRLFSGGRVRWHENRSLGIESDEGTIAERL